MYDAQEVLNNIDDDKWWVLTFCGLAMLCNYVWFVYAYLQAKKEQVFTIPLFCTFYWLAHDSSLVYRFDDWFNEYDHWFMKMFWGMFVLTVTFELLFVWQVWRYGRKELFPGLSQGAFGALLVVTAGFSFIIWEFVKYVFDDPIYLLGFGVLITAYPIMGAAQVIHRRSAVGQTTQMWAWFTAMGVFFYPAAAIWFGDEWRTWQWYALAVISVGGGAVMTYVVHQMRTHGKTFGLVAPDTTPVLATAPARV